MTALKDVLNLVGMLLVLASGALWSLSANWEVSLLGKPSSPALEAVLALIAMEGVWAAHLACGGAIFALLAWVLPAAQDT